MVINTRRQWLQRASSGFGAVALTSLFHQDSLGLGNELQTDSQGAGSQGKPLHGFHHPPKAKSVIFLYMDGGPSQVDTFDPKPLLDKHSGKDPADFFSVAPTQFNNNGKLLASPWKFSRHGESGIEISSLFPGIAQHADELAVVRSMTSQFPEHTFANYFLHTGSGLQGRPSMGAWVTYGLGSENQNLPGFIVLNGGLTPPGGLDCFGNGFLAATYQGSVLRPTGTSVANVSPLESSVERQARKLALLKELDQGTVDTFGQSDAVEAAIANYEMAFRMQTEIPTLCDLSSETAETQKAYGLEAEYDKTRIFGRECLLARRLVEKGVRFIELTCPDCGFDRWDQHSNLKEGHEANAKSVDQPIAALLADLKQRGLLDSTLVVFTGEFGRTPFAQGENGRDHNPFGFSMWMAGGGVRGGTTYGETDEFGYHAIADKCDIHDLHATMLHLLGIDHTRSTFRFGGRDMRLTDVHGRVLKGILA